MRLPDDYEDRGGGLTPTVISAIVAVTIFVAVILTVVLIMNRQPASHQQNNTAAQTENVQQAGNNQTDKYPDTQDLITGSTLTPSDLDFWDMYPETTATPLPSAEPSQKDNKKETAEADPSTDGKHTLVTNRDFDWTGAHTVKVYKVTTAAMNDYLSASGPSGLRPGGLGVWAPRISTAPRRPGRR